MKYCPTCDTRFDDAVMRFCTKDGSPLVDEEQPNFVAMPTEAAEEPAIAADDEEAGEVTVVRRNIPVPAPDMDDDFSDVKERPAERIIIPMTPVPAVDPLRNPRSAAYYQQPKKPNTFLVVVLTVFGTVIILGIGAGLFWLLQKDRRAANANLNSNINLNSNLNTNTGFDSNFNFNVNPSAPVPTPANFNTNINLKTPSPTPSPTTTPTPRPSASATPTPDIEVMAPATPRPSPTASDGRPRMTPTPSTAPTQRSTPRPTPHTFGTP